MYDPGKQTAELFAEGLQAFARKDNRAARAAFDRVALICTMHPELAERRVHALVNCAVAAANLGDHADAIATYGTALDLCDTTPGDNLAVLRPTALLGLPPVLMHTGDFDGAEAALERARAILEDETSPVQGSDRITLLISAILSLTMLASHREDWVRANELATESLALVTAHQPELVGAPLMNLADIALHTGRIELAEDFGAQALAAFERFGDLSGAAEMRRSLGQMYLRTERFDEAEPLLTAAQAFFESAGMRHQAAAGLDMLGLLAAARGRNDEAGARFAESAGLFELLGQPVQAAEARGRQGILLYLGGDRAGGEALLSGAASAHAAHGMPVRCAQVHMVMAVLFEQLQDAAMLARAADLAVPAALAIDAVGYTLANGRQRDQWRRNVAEPAMRLAFHLAARSGNGPLVAQLVESRCAGSTLEHRPEPDGTPLGMESLLYPPDAPVSIGTALAEAAAGAGVGLAVPPRLALTPEGGIALDVHLTRAAERYGLRVRSGEVIPTW